MKIKPIRFGKKARIEIVPMIDIMFFLLATVMLSSLYLKNYNLLEFNQKVNLPKGTVTEDVIAKYKNITINANDEIIFENQVLQSAELINLVAKFNKNDSIIIVADSKASHGRVIELIDLAKSSGFANFSIVTQK